MTWTLIVGLIAIVLLMSVNSSGHIPWRDKMRRLRGSAQKSEWMAPDDVVQQVRAHYLDAIHWLNDSMLMSWAQQWAGAPKHLNGSYLKRYRNLLLTQRESAPLTGVLRADHSIEVREFSETGGFCLVIDQQTGRRMATYNRRSHARLHTQDLGDGVVVHAMLYDAADGRWKIGGFLQELPLDWRTRATAHLSKLPGAIGRDY